MGLPGGFRDGKFNGNMQNVVGLTHVATATKFRLGAEIQSPTDLLLVIFVHVVCRLINSRCQYILNLRRRHARSRARSFGPYCAKRLAGAWHLAKISLKLGPILLILEMDETAHSAPRAKHKTPIYFTTVISFTDLLTKVSIDIKFLLKMQFL